MRTSLLQTSLLGALAFTTAFLPHGARAQDDGPFWIFGRTPEVFQPSRDVIATRVGGWADFVYEDNDIDHERQSANVNHVNFFFDTRYRDHVQLFVEAEYEFESDLHGYEEEREIELEQAYLRYRVSDALGLRVGQFNLPFGIWTPVHWSILMDTISRPIHEGNRLVPEQSAGAEVAGLWLLPSVLGKDAELRYALYAGYGDDDGLLSETKTDGLSFGSDLRLLLDDRILFGFSLYQRDNRDDIDRTEQNVMLYAEAELGPSLLVRSEFLRQQRDKTSLPGLSREINVAYAKARWRFRDDAYLNYRYEFGDDDDPTVTLDRFIHTLTLGYQPTSRFRIKLEYSSHEFKGGPRKDFNYWGASIGVLF